MGGDNHGPDPAASDAIRTLLTEVENNRKSVLVIMAGYKDKMAKFMRADPGLRRWFPKDVHLSDYTPAELSEIIKRRAQQDRHLEFEEGLQERLTQKIDEDHAAEIEKHNAGLAINLLDSAVQNRAVRLRRTAQEIGQAAANGDKILVATDFEIFEAPPDETAAQKEEVWEDMKAMIGMDNVKDMFTDLVKKIKFVEAGGDKKILQVCQNLVLTGNPGTGKTTVARMLFRFMHVWGILPKDNFVERNGLELMGQYVGSTTPLGAHYNL